MSRVSAPQPGGMIKLGQRIRELREEKGLSLRALADKVGVSAPFLSDLEHGRRGTERIPEIAKALGASSKELEKLSGKWPPELKSWLNENPSVVDLLQEVRASGKPVDEVRAALKSSLKR